MKIWILAIEHYDGHHPLDRVWAFSTEESAHAAFRRFAKKRIEELGEPERGVLTAALADAKSDLTSLAMCGVWESLNMQWSILPVTTDSDDELEGY